MIILSFRQIEKIGARKKIISVIKKIMELLVIFVCKETPVWTSSAYPSFAKRERRLRLPGHSWRSKSE